MKQKARVVIVLKKVIRVRLSGDSYKCATYFFKLGLLGGVSQHDFQSPRNNSIRYVL